ncbi:gamma-tubulin complex component 2-like [Tropilaelaps mercedesae]|uniref:Gamma-tubulin complex component 2-like n=1 Tax=Tropilaelaps mercedesae TaxID=418985 RepID=A0A1V9XC86_9ACAR|nr:gamma-tubulin complex component 2-like [Tropilaelaps mercedesae]
MSESLPKSARRGGSRSNIRLLSETSELSARDQRNDDSTGNASTTVLSETVRSKQFSFESSECSGSSWRLSYDNIMSIHQQKEAKWAELLKRLCAHLTPDSETAEKQYQTAQKLLKGRKSTGFDNACTEEAVYVEKIREHLRRSKDSIAAERFLFLSGRLSLLSSSRKDYIFYRTTLYSFLLTLGTGVDDASCGFVSSAPAQSDKLNAIFRQRRAGYPASRPLSTPCALPDRNGEQKSSSCRLLDDGQLDKNVIRSVLNLLVARGPEQIHKMKEDAWLDVESRFEFHTELTYRIAAAEDVANNLVQLTQFQQHAAKSRSLVVQRLAEALDNQLMRHKQLIALLEQMNTQGKLSLARVNYLCLQPDNLIYLLSDVCRPFIQRANVLSGNQVLDALYRQAACSPTGGAHFEMANTLLRHCLQPWLSMLRSWMLRGQLANTKWDLFVHDVGREGVSNLWYDKFTIQKDYVPKFLNDDDTRKILSVGKAMVFLKEADDIHRVAEMQRQLALVMGVESKSTAVAVELDNGDQSRIVDNMESRSADPRGFLGAAYELAMQRMKTVILDHFHLKTHLLLIRDVVLLYDGVFSKALLSNLSDELSETSGGLLSEVERSEVSRMVYRLLPELPEVEAAAFIGVHFDGGSSGSTTLESFGLKYKLREPLSFVLQNNSFVFYNRIFAHLFRVRKFSFLFSELIAELQTVRVKTSEEFYVLNQCRFLLHEIMNFVLNLESYQFSHVVTTAWAELERRTDAMISVDDLSDAHNAFVENLLKGLFLEGEDNAGIHLRSLFIQMEKIHSFVRGVLVGLQRPGAGVAPELFKRCELDITRYRSTMLEFLRILSEHEDDKMVQFLWMNFDFNQFYSDKHYSLIMSVTQGHRKMIK